MKKYIFLGIMVGGSVLQPISLTANTIDTLRLSETNYYVMQSQQLVEDLMLEPINGQVGSAIVDYAMLFLGNPYVYGGNDLNIGVDCSGFVQQVFKAFDINVPRTSKAQSKTGMIVQYEDLQKGDLLFFGSNLEDITHVGIYVGDHQMIHSSTPETGIIISPIQLSGSTPLQVIRRMIV